MTKEKDIPCRLEDYYEILCEKYWLLDGADYIQTQGINGDTLSLRAIRVYIPSLDVSFRWGSSWRTESQGEDDSCDDAEGIVAFYEGDEEDISKYTSYTFGDEYYDISERLKKANLKIDNINDLPCILKFDETST